MSTDEKRKEQNRCKARERRTE
jgi:hypothetical protein